MASITGSELGDGALRTSLSIDLRLFSEVIKIRRSGNWQPMAEGEPSNLGLISLLCP